MNETIKILTWLLGGFSETDPTSCEFFHTLFLQGNSDEIPSSHKKVR